MMSCISDDPFGHSVPRLIGWSGSPSTCTTCAVTFFALSPNVSLTTPQLTEQYGQVDRVSVVRAIFSSSYGEDLGIKDGLALLIARLAEIETPHPKWVRFLYCYPNRITQKLLDTIAEHEALVKYIDMPLQHASASVLKGMKRARMAIIS